MKVNLLQKVQGRMRVVSGILLIGIVGLSTTLQMQGQKTTKLGTLQEGLQTCFTRVHNTLTARLMGSFNSQYLSEGFTNITEECFAETVSFYEGSNLSLGNALDNLNTLSSDVHWFHEKALSSIGGSTLGGGNPENVLVNLITGRFSKLENRRDAVYEVVSKKKNEILNDNKKLNRVFYILISIFPLFILFDIFAIRRGERRISKEEKRGRELIDSDQAVMQETMPVVQEALKKSGYEQLAKAFELASSRMKHGEGVGSFGDTVTADSQWEETTSELMKIRPTHRDKNFVTPREVVSVEGVLGSVVDLVSSKIFTMGINLDIDSEPVFVDAEREALEQIFYHILTNSINGYRHDDPNKYLSITMRKLGGTLLVDFFDSGREFSSEFLKKSAGFSSHTSEKGRDLLLAKELISDIQGQLSFENVASESSDRIIGRKVQIALSIARKESGKKLSRVEKGTKKELQAKLGRSRRY